MVETEMLWWTEYRPGEGPRDATDELRRALGELNAITRQVRIAIDTYYMFRELARRRSISDAIAGSPIEYGVRIVVGAIIRDLIIGLASVFDAEAKATNLKRVINNLLRPTHADIFRRWHAIWPVPYDTENGIAQLRYWQKRINSGKPARAIERIIDLRRKAIAHVDLAPDFKEGRPQVWEIEYVLVAVASIVRTANLFATGRNIDAQQLRSHSRKRIEEFSRALLAGNEILNTLVDLP
jgi:hypothetical protein